MPQLHVPLAGPAGGDAICWDSGPHRGGGHAVFVWLNRDERHVLCADGRVGTLPEEQFRRQGLRGVSLVLWPQ